MATLGSILSSPLLKRNIHFSVVGVCNLTSKSFFRRMPHSSLWTMRLNHRSSRKLGCSGFNLQVSCMSNTSETGKVSEGDIVEAVSQIIAKQLTVDPSTVKPDSKLVELGVDSLDTVEIMMSIEDHFNISLPEEGAEKVTTVQEAVNLIKEVMPK